MDERIAQALARDQVIDITTTGRKSGQPRRIEIWFHRWNGRYYITGLPGRRDWYANLLANPDFTFHLKQSAQADLPARARPILDEAERRAILAGILQSLKRDDDLDEWVARSPLVEVGFGGIGEQVEPR
ncbi:MAG TPA: nitroreductase family deazaflavin-dependent oxidoreductase [Chloroflexi bacterium]|nr:nitroreductase family deazaflavin-dependent oxidoreductase [Chloroflexota bacterium]